MSQDTHVFKFGGASLSNAEGFKNVGNILKKYQDQNTLIVVSALGKTTNALEKVVDAYVNEEDTAFELLDEVKKQHYKIALDLFGSDTNILDLLNDTFVEIEWVIEEAPQDSYDYIYDQIVSIGEMASTRLLAAWLRQQELNNKWLDARDVIATDNTFREAKINWQKTEKLCLEILPTLLQNHGFVITQGFIGGTQENFTTTLGREGSDFSAAIFAYCLNAKSVCIWKDVPGILNGDPKLFKDAILLPKLSYREAIEMTYYGAKVLHPKTIKPIENKNIPLYVKSFLQADEVGTLIQNEDMSSYPPVIVIEPNQVLLKISTKDFSFVAENHLAHLFALFAKNRIKINMMQNMAISFTVCVTERSDRLTKLIAELETTFNIKVERGLKLITIRHYNEEIVEELSKGKKVLFEEYIRGTMSMVVT